VPELVLDRAPFTVRLRDVLRSVGQVDGEIGRVPPSGVGQVSPTLFVAYFVLYAIDGGTFDGPPLHWPESTGTFVYQVSCVGATGHQADAVADRVRRVFLGRTGSTYTTSLDVAATAQTDGLRVVRRENIGVGGFDAGELLVTLPVRYAFGVTLGG
jgi:hypothetical protein